MVQYNIAKGIVVLSLILDVFLSLDLGKERNFRLKVSRTEQKNIGFIIG